MKVIDSIHIKNCFKHKDVFIEFEEGLNYIIGPEGSGKSLILECISFAYFGNTALRGPVTSYKKLEVILIFNYLGNKFKIERKTSDANFYMFSNNKWVNLVTGTTPVNQKIITLLGYDYNIFLLSNYCQQGELQSFSKMTPAKKLSFIDKISGIEDAKELLTFLETRKKDLKKELESLKKLIIPLPEIDENLLELDFDKEITLLKEKEDSLTKSLIKSTEINSEINSIEKQLVILNKITYPELFYNFNTYDDFQNFFNENKRIYEEQKTINKSIKEILSKFYIYDLDDINITLEELNKYIEDLEYNKKVDEKNKYLNCDITLCPNCSFTFYIKHNELQSYCDIDIHKRDIKLKINNPELLKTYLTDYKDTYETLKYSLNSLVINNELLDDKILLKFKEYLQNFELIKSLKIQLKDLKFEYLLYYNDEFSKEILEVQTKLSTLIKQQSEVSYYLKLKELTQKTQDKVDNLDKEYKDLVLLIEEVKAISDKIKKESIPLINYHSGVLLNEMSDSVLNKIEITDNYSILVDDKDINLCSGSEKDTSSLAFRLSLGNSIILGMLPLFLGDEIDSSSRIERTMLITNVLQNLSDKGYQIILITHKDTSTFENCNIIDLNNVK